jgi:hypothetical protein
VRIDVDLTHRDVEAELANLHARMRRAGDVLQGLPAIPAGLRDLVLRFREADGEFYVYVEDTARHVLAGCTVFNHVHELDRPTARYVRSPHSRYAAGYQRCGVATAVYRWALAAGLCLVSGARQSPGAHRLWQSLARTHRLELVCLRERRLAMVDAAQPCALDALETRMLLLGTGWTVETLLSRGAAPAVAGSR